MGAFKELDILFQEIDEDLKSILQKLENIKDTLSGTSKPDSKQVKPTVTLEQLRSLLSEMARDGMAESVKQLLLRNGADRLSKLNPSLYEEVYLFAEEIRNGNK